MFMHRSGSALPHLKPGSVLIATTSEQAYDPSPELYDYAQTKAATMNYVESWPSNSAPRASEPMGWRRVPSGRNCRFQVRPDGEARKVPLGRPGQPAELGSIYVQQRGF